MPDELTREGQRILTLCNACRYCEGYCAVFPALERRTIFSPDDLNFLANLCHNCGECYHACPYTPPHEYALNVPKTLAQIRTRSYEQYAWPSALARLHRKRGGALLLAAAVAILGLFFAPRGATFYQVIPHEAMAGVFSASAVWIAAALAVGVVRMWGRLPTCGRLSIGLPGFRAALRQALTQKHMTRGPRRSLHHATFYGFLLCFASTSVAAFYHFALNWRAPYPYLSLPVVLGTLGGIAMVVGTSGQFWMKWRQDPALADASQRGEDQHFIALLWLISVTGLALLAWRESAAMPALLVIHLAVVFALFMTMPYGKFVHGIYRLAALIRNAGESTS